uniref:Uncharacterized protein n=1 Tax=Glossina palpalis gambiensis TaxID=67801 RepID=A0A1B0AUY0_9MUSC
MYKNVPLHVNLNYLLKLNERPSPLAYSSIQTQNAANTSRCLLLCCALTVAFAYCWSSLAAVVLQVIVWCVRDVNGYHMIDDI